MTWWTVLPGLALLAATVFGPGWILLRLVRMRGLLPLAGAPALSLAFYGLAGIGLDRAGIPWGWPALLALLFIAALLAAGAGAWPARDARRRIEAGQPGQPAGLWAGRYARLGRVNAGWIGAVVLGAGLIMAVPIARGMVSPDALLQHWDAVFHTNGVQAIRETGNASTFGAMQSMFGAVGPDFYYPATWHSIIAITPGFTSIAAGANASTFVFGVLVWLTGLAGLGHVLFAGRRHGLALTVLTVALGASFGAFPFVVLSTLALWPFGAAIALIPGTTALVVASLTGVSHGVRFTTRARLTVTLLVLGGAGGAVGLTHASAFFSLLLVLVPFALAAAGRATARRLARGNRGRIIATGIGGVVLTLLVLVLILGHPTVQAMLKFDRNTNTPFWASAYQLVADLPLAAVPFGSWPVTLCVLAGMGLGVLGRAGQLTRPVRFGWLRRRTAGFGWLGWGLILTVTLTAFAAGPEGPLRMLTGFWYAQSARVAAVYPVLAAPLAALGLVTVAAWAVTRLRARGPHRDDVGPGEVAHADDVGSGAARGRRTVALVSAGWVALGLVVTLGWHVDLKTERFEQAYVPGKIRWGTMASDEEIALLKRLPDTTPEDALILGDPANGAAFAWSVAGRHLVLPHLGESGMSVDQRLLREQFNELGDNPEICAAINRLVVTHFYLDSATTEDGAKEDRFGPGLQQPMTEGLKQVDSGGSATLFEITACD